MQIFTKKGLEFLEKEIKSNEDRISECYKPQYYDDGKWLDKDMKEEEVFLIGRRSALLYLKLSNSEKPN